jgi:hypothetical protein
MRAATARKNLMISDSEPVEAGVAWENYIWIDTATRKIKNFTGGKWVVVADFADSLPEGITAEIPLKKLETMVFEKGLLVKYG